MGLITELKRRNVFRVAIAYTVIAWVLAAGTATAQSADNAALKDTAIAAVD